MPGKKASADLFELIHAMTPSEKRHFRMASVRAIGDDANRYMQLFDIVEHQAESDDDATRKKLGIREKARFSRLKNYLYKALLESLEDYYRDQTVDAQFFHLMNRAQILISKRLYTQAGKLLRKAGKLSESKGNGAFAILLETLELSRLTQEESLRRMESRLEEYDAFRSEHVQRTGDFLDLQMIKCKATWLLRHGDKDRQRKEAWLEELREHRLLAANPYPHDIEFTLYHYNLNGLVHSLMGDAEKDFQFRLAYLETYQSNPEYIQRWPQNYIVALGNVAGACAPRADYERLFACTEEMRTFLDRENIRNRAGMEPLIEIRSYGFELEAYPVMDLAQRSALHDNLLEAHAKHGESVAEIWRIVTRYGLGRYSYYHGDLEEAIHFLSLVVHESDAKIYPALQAASRVLYAMTHFKAGNERYLENYLPKLREWLRQQSLTYPVLFDLIRECKQALFKRPLPFPEQAWAALEFDAHSREAQADEKVRELLAFLSPDSRKLSQNGAGHIRVAANKVPKD